MRALLALLDLPWLSMTIDHSVLSHQWPAGAQCPGGSLGLENPVLTLSGYWRSSNTSAQVYRCASQGACHGYPSASGEAYGDAACPPGSVGPLCAVCAPGSFGFGGQCKSASCHRIPILY